MNKRILKYCIILASTIPPALIGAVVMRAYGLPLTLYMQNIISILVLWVISCLIIRRQNKKNLNVQLLFVVIILAIYVLTFLDSGLNGVNRWITIGPIRLYVSSIFTPVLIILLWKLLHNVNVIISVIITISISSILLFQPDASQLTAFCIPMIFIFFSKIDRRYILISIMSILTFMIIYSWVFLDSLSPVIYVEEIIGLVNKMGFFVSILGIVSIALLPLPFLLFPRYDYKKLSRYIGLYYLIVLLSTFFGNFPVPIMGFGVSPILGYFIAIIWLFNSSNINIEVNETQNKD